MCCIIINTLRIERKKKNEKESKKCLNNFDYFKHYFLNIEKIV